uniref:Uncharacterized protein n=1 Tax=Candidatus Kentrum sp. MB TaxID=2138164 RepID=A0A450XHR5_9GAMM|nr:MAG: hypothetical protein BECKMB1821I_GA0114274_100756 [Candidatus Kentron sp. MB]VFK74124.1 MAG: hypothetical protein BECKMB1821H_GA0114242_100155 [Candidatus Kentron sp. MB]
MTKQKERKLSYRRVIWPTENQTDLEQHLRKVHESFTTTKQRTFSYSEGDIQGAKIAFEGDAGGLFAHLTSYVHHQPASVVPYPGDAESNETDLHMPPEKHNFSGKEIFFLIEGNDVVLCANNLHENAVTSYIKDILRKAGKENLTTLFSIEPVANVDKLRVLREEGVKAISLGASIYEATLRYEERKTTRMTMLNEAARAFMAHFGKDFDEKEMENLSVKVEYSFKPKKKGGELVGERMEAAAIRLVDEDDDGFKIVTQKENSVSANQLRLGKKVKFSPHGDTIFRSEAWEKLKKYMDELRDDGLLAQ